MHPELTKRQRAQVRHGRARASAGSLAAALLCLPLTGLAQVGNNSYARILSSSNTMLQNSMTTIISSQARTNQQLRQATGGQGAAPQTQGGGAAPGGRTVAAGGHLPLSATSFVPPLRGHPMFAQYMAAAPLTPQDQATVRQALQDTLQTLAIFDPNVPVIPNNLASSIAFAIVMAKQALINGAEIPDAVQARYLYTINDRVATAPALAGMLPVQKQNLSDTLLFEGTMIKVLFQSGPQYRAQCLQLSRTVLQQITGSPNGPDF